MALLPNVVHFKNTIPNPNCFTTWNISSKRHPYQLHPEFVSYSDQKKQSNDFKLADIEALFAWDQSIDRRHPSVSSRRMRPIIGSRRFTKRIENYSTDGLWRCCLELGRLPQSEEIPNLNALLAAAG